MIMTATLRTKKDRPNYYICIRFQNSETGKNSEKWVATDIQVKGNNKRRAEQRLKEVIKTQQKELICPKR